MKKNKFKITEIRKSVIKNIILTYHLDLIIDRHNIQLDKKLIFNDRKIVTTDISSLKMCLVILGKGFAIKFY